MRSIVPWAADQVDVSTQFEIGHFEACTADSHRAMASDPALLGYPQLFGPIMGNPCKR